MLQIISDINFIQKPFSDFFIESFKLANDGISRLYTLSVMITISNHKMIDEVKMETYLNKYIQIKIDHKNKESTYFSGIITAIKLYAFVKKEVPFQYKIIIKPYLSLLKKNNGFRTWENKNTTEVIKSLLEFYKGNKDEFSYNIEIFNRDQILKRTNTVQYGESDYRFFCRLLQENSLNYFFKQTEKGHDLIITDDIETALQKEKLKPLELQITPHFRKNIMPHGSFYGYTHITSLGMKTVKTFFTDPRKFGRVFASHSTEKTNAQFSSIWEDHPKFKKSSQNLEPSSTRPNAELIRKNSMTNYLKTSTNLIGAFASRIIKFIYIGTTEKELPLKMDTHIVCRGTHFFSRPNVHGEHSKTKIGKKLKSKNTDFLSEITLYPASKKYLKNFRFKYQQTTPRLATATVYGEKPEDLKIQNEDSGILIGISFYWQTKEKSSLNCSPFLWARLSQIWASKGYGSLFLPQPGDEVLISFEEDIELPIIISYLYNSANKVPKNLNPQIKGFILNEELEQSFTFGVKNQESSFIFQEKNLQMNIKNKVTNKLSEEGLYSLTTQDYQIENKASFKLSTENAEIRASKKIELEGKSGAKINKLNIKN